MNTRSLKYLVALAETASFSDAADACGVSQATVSAQIKKLEQDLGVELVDRSLRKVNFTRTGDKVLADARRILALVESIERHAVKATDPKTSSFKLGLFPTSGPYLLPHISSTISARYPHLELQLVEAKSPDIEQQLLEGALDIGVLADPVNNNKLISIPLFSEEFVLAVPSKHALAKQDSVKPTEIPVDDLMLLEEGHCLRDQAIEVCQNVANLAQPSQRSGGFQATSLETLRHMVGAGNGITLLPRLATTHPVVNPPSVKLIEFQAPKPTRSLSLVWKRSHPHTNFFNELAESMIPRDGVGEAS